MPTPPNLKFKDLPMVPKEEKKPFDFNFNLRQSDNVEKLLLKFLEQQEKVLETLHNSLNENIKSLTEAIQKKELNVTTQKVEIPPPPKVQNVRVENPVHEVLVANPPKMKPTDLSALVKQNQTIISLLTELVNKEPQLGGQDHVEQAKPSTPLGLFRRLRNRTTYTEEFSYDGSGSITLKRIPIRGTERVYIGGQRQKKENEQNYTIVGKEITFVRSIRSGTDISVDYDV